MACYCSSGWLAKRSASPSAKPAEYRLGHNWILRLHDKRGLEGRGRGSGGRNGAELQRHATNTRRRMRVPQKVTGSEAPIVVPP
jgi:hypothetical protein